MHAKSHIHVDIMQDVLEMMNTIWRLSDLLKEIENVVSNSTSTIFSNANAMLADVEKFLKEISDAVGHFQFDKIANILSNIWKNITNFNHQLEELEDGLYHLKTETANITTSFIRNEVTLLKERLDDVVYKLKNNLTSALKEFSGVGLRFRAELRIFFLKLGGIDAELVYSNDNLLRCSRFHAVQRLFKDEHAVRILGRFSYGLRLGPFLKCDIGEGLGFAIAEKSKHVFGQFNAHINVLGIITTGDIFISNEGVRFYIEGNIWNVFYAQLECHAGSIGTDWHGLEFSVSGRFVAKARKKRQTQADSTNFEASYLNALRKVITNIADGAKKRLSQVQGAFTYAQGKLTNAQQWLEEKKRDVRSANSAFDSAVRSMDIAKDKLEAAKGPFRRAIEKLNAAQRKVDNLCRIRHCNTVCVPGIKLSWCHKEFLGLNFPYPCFHFTSCMLSISDPVCYVANLGCRAIRAVAYAGLEVAKIFVRLPMLALDAAKLAVSVAQVVVDKSRVVLKLAEGALEVGKIALGAAKGGLELAKKAIDGLKMLIGAAAKVLDFVIGVGLQSLIDVRNCGFLVKLSTVDIFVIDVSCDINAFKLGWRKIEVRINFKDILQSLWNAAKSVIKGLMDSIGDAFTRRKRREIESDVTSKMHIFTRHIRADDDPLTKTIDIFNETFSFVNGTETFPTNYASDFDDRVVMFQAKCTEMKRHLSFLKDTLHALHDIALESKSSLDSASNLTSEIEVNNNALKDTNFTAESLGIDVDYAHHYNLSKHEIDKTLEGKKKSLEDDQHLAEIRNMTAFAKEVVKSQVQSVDLSGITDTWMLALENITEKHFNGSECVGFRDCVLFSILSMYDIYAVGNHANITNLRFVLTDLEDFILDIVSNSSLNIHGIHNSTTKIKAYLYQIDEMNIYCSKPPKLASSPQNVSTIWGGNATFYCKVDSEIEASYWWYREDKLIPNERGNTLSIRNVTDDTLAYRCKAGNVVANITSSAVFVVFITPNGSKNLKLFSIVVILKQIVHVRSSYAVLSGTWISFLLYPLYN